MTFEEDFPSLVAYNSHGDNEIDYDRGDDVVGTSHVMKHCIDILRFQKAIKEAVWIAHDGEPYIKIKDLIQGVGL